MEIKRYWLRFKQGRLEELYRTNCLNDMEKFVNENNINDSEIISITEYR